MVNSFTSISTSRIAFIGDKYKSNVWRDRPICYMSCFMVGTSSCRIHSRNVLAMSLDQHQSQKNDDYNNNNNIMMSFATFRRGSERKGARLKIPRSVISFLTKYTRHLTTALVIILVAASIQALIEYQQYQKNPRGKLVVPPGATQGEEIHDETDGDEESSSSAGNLLLEMKNSALAAYQSTKQKWELKRMEIQQKLLSPKKASATTASTTSAEQPQQQKTNQTYNLVVIGDSLACGVGCVNKWDKIFYDHKTSHISSIDAVEEQTADDNNSDGPILPRILANTLSQRFRCNVRWRSAGVVGGCVEDIQRECMDVIRQEVKSGNPPNVVVVLCGMNDIRTHITKLFRGASTFRNSLQNLCEELHREAPSSLIVLPALPVMYEKNSKNMILAFPAALLAECFIRFWDLQKRRLAKKLGPTQTMFISRPDAAYVSSSLSPSSPSLTAEDGVHPSDYGYFVWARFLANSLADNVQNLQCTSNETKVLPSNGR